MASTLPSYDSSYEDYIDMDLSSCSTNTSPPQSREFEFPSCFISKETTNSPADELFYKGKLLPLHLSPRLRMLQKLLMQSSKPKEAFEEEKAPSSTPLEESGNNISSSETCRVSCELNMDDEYFFEWSTELSSFFRSNHPKKSWPKKLKLIKNSILGHKLKAYLKSFFSRSDESSCAKAATCNVEPENLSKNKNSFGNIEGAAYPCLATIMKGIEKEGIPEDNYVHRRSSFSGATKSKCSSSSGASSLSSSCSFNLNAFHEFHFRKSSSSATEIDGSIEAAIAHCKKSQVFFDSRNTSGFSSLPGIPASNYQQRLDVSSI
ncbi:probable membrane-associated kinase regulator 3 [Olea europaea var. sylvestris]|uniref:probable membrane-associated kinase regulator 3 n=1 Tax=Olea europaea var. sylvestris TaxID=158386 RepID=UPI000C1D29BC|nr:probable membrane-associated kinase regulator 3 [Olea europaea var. sylvestris]